jgi:hypothetical protein
VLHVIETIDGPLQVSESLAVVALGDVFKLEIPLNLGVVSYGYFYCLKFHL